MKFEEQGNIITFQNLEECFVYFLLRDEEVVYVGQTSIGISRPFSHKDKYFTSVKLIPCDFDKLDETEDFYIGKYKPIYNKSRNYAYVYSVQRTKLKLKEKYNVSFNIRTLRKILKHLNITTFMDDYTGNECITVIQFHEICDFIERS